MDDTQKQEEKVTLEFSKSTLWQVISGVLAVILVVSIFTGGFGFGASNNNNAGTGRIGNQPTAGNNIPTGAIAVDAKQLEDDDAFLGDKNAKVTMIEFSDFQCPFCRKFWNDALPQIKSQYIDTGKVK